MKMILSLFLPMLILSMTVVAQIQIVHLADSLVKKISKNTLNPEETAADTM